MEAGTQGASRNDPGVSDLVALVDKCNLLEYHVSTVKISNQVHNNMNHELLSSAEYADHSDMDVREVLAVLNAIVGRQNRRHKEQNHWQVCPTVEGLEDSQKEHSKGNLVKVVV